MRYSFGRQGRKPGLRQDPRLFFFFGAVIAPNPGEHGRALTINKRGWVSGRRGAPGIDTVKNHGKIFFHIYIYIYIYVQVYIYIYIVHICTYMYISI